MKNKLSTIKIVTGAAVLVFALPCSSLNAQSIINDTFTGANGGLAGTAPDTDLPGTTWLDTGTYWGTSQIVGNQASANTDRGAEISLAGVTLPTLLTESASLTTNALTGTTGRGDLVGFYTADASAAGHGYNGLLGFNLQPDGTLNFVNSLSTGNVFNVIGSQAYTLGTFSTSAVENLSFTVNTVTGALVSATLTDANGTETYAFTTTAFTSSSLLFGAIAVSSNDGNTTGLFDNFSIQGAAVPEPSSWALISLGLGAMVLTRFRRQLL